MNKNFKIIIQKVSSNEEILSLGFTSLLEMEIAYRILMSSIIGTTSYVRTMARDDSGVWNGFEID
ncbi:hypothetical protein PQE71_gp050 [Bacillus phage Izhevsk]|uniref:Uncharacterized protein n=1 Tax=Bacillus phage Izhevsk TaxID=2724322 RepID=A0A6H0X664_9CAUD|nr:hypothetical protein PQE71_gp050 [Bacillus phage Izhevsk]QIW89732.1 hypothetical protein Izhevsk_50 [Bacillus phage Izhevsk]